ncbi:hypothetical protein Hypma_004070 [Hypsizygus marmoreus]|uniref:Uncharacterized protein n=1 Tax=Hypsizygus marmoreus TaxID=39966 RepID=A0A369J2G1_HYPMA|nr:hypothetical protein Hypma_004070 [Hypsizygus marmoreus]
MTSTSSAKRCCATGLELSCLEERYQRSLQFERVATPTADLLLATLTRCIPLHHLILCPMHYVSSVSPCRYDVNKMYPHTAISRTFNVTCHTPRRHDSLAASTYCSLHSAPLTGGPLLMTLRRYYPVAIAFPGLHTVSTRTMSSMTIYLLPLSRRCDSQSSPHHVNKMDLPQAVRTRRHRVLLDLAGTSIPRSTNDTPPLRHQLSPQPGWSSQKTGHVGTLYST